MAKSENPLLCDHPDTEVGKGNSRWIGDTFVEDTVEYCVDCGEVLAVI